MAAKTGGEVQQEAKTCELRAAKLNADAVFKALPVIPGVGVEIVGSAVA